jgi:hypothetical protein
MLVSAPSFAGLITTNPDLPPDGDYVSVAGWEYPQSSDPTIRLQDVVLRPLFSPPPVNVNIGPDESIIFQGRLEANEVGVGWGATTLEGAINIVHQGKADQTTGTFLGEIISLELSGTISSVGKVLFRESPTLDSDGQTAITDIGGGLYRIDSFFDVFTELSLDQGTTWLPSMESTRLTLEPEQIPAPAPFALLVAGLAGLWMRRARTLCET